MAYEHNEEPDKDLATRKGEFAMLIFSIGESETRFESTRGSLNTWGVIQLLCAPESYCPIWLRAMDAYSLNTILRRMLIFLESGALSANGERKQRVRAGLCDCP
jgi:hypothetical protein